MRKKIINIHFYCTFQEFKKNIFEFFKHIDHYKQELGGLISWNFHVPKTKTIFY